MTVKGTQSRCGSCGELGHNRSRCTGPTPLAGRGRAPGAGEVAKAAREILPTLDSAHPAARLLAAAAQRLAQDIDEAREVRDRVAATRALIEVCNALDAAPPPLGSPPGGDIPAAEGADAVEPDNPFGIPDVPPNVGYSPPS